MPGGPKPRPPAARFWAKVDTSGGPDACWPWLAGKTPGGYGTFNPGTGPTTAHRWAYEDAYGPIPPGREIDHVKARGCTRIDCVNPAHLEAVTPQVNTLRSDNMGGRNARKTHCPQGHEYTPENTIPNGKNRRGRLCKTCHREHGRATRRRKAERIAA